MDEIRYAEICQTGTRDVRGWDVRGQVSDICDKGMGIVGISLDREHDAWVQAIGELGITWPQMSDLKYWQSAAVEMFQVQAIPYMVVVDRQGVILNRGLRGDDLEQFVATQLQGRP